MAIFALRIPSICGSTVLIEELVHRMTTSGFAALSALAASAETFAPSLLGRPTTSPRSRPTLAGSMSIAPTILKPGRAATCLTIAAPIGPSPKCMTLMLGITRGLYAAREGARHSLGGTMAPSMAHDHSGGLTRDHIVWAYRLLLDRDPESEDVIGPKLAGSGTTAELRRHLITSAEFREKNPDFAHTNDSTVVIKEIAPGVRLFLDLSDHVISLNILRGHYEQEEIGLVRAMLKPGDSVVD